MKLTNFNVASAVFIAATLNFGAQGSPRPQINIRDGSTNSVTVNRIVFDGPTSRSKTSLTDPPAGPSNVLDGIVFDGPTSGSRTVLTDPPARPSNVLEGIVFDEPTNGSPASRPEVALCGRNCKFQGTPEYNPVCGSDGVTYNNAGQLMCTINCGINVSQLRTGRCPAPSETVTSNPPTPAPATVRPDIALCAQDCMVTSQYNPVCGSDGVMYNNAELLICARNCGINVTQLHTGPCTVKASRV